MNHIKNQKGAMLVFELVILAAVLVVAGFAGYQYMKNAKAVNKAATPRPHVVDKSTPSPSPSPYSARETYCSGTGGVCFKYPPDWTETQSGQAPFVSVTITSPSKSVQVLYQPQLQGMGGACPPADCLFDEESVTPLSSSNTLGLEVIKGVFTNKGNGPTYYLPNFFLTTPDRMAAYKLQLNQTVGVGYFGAWFTSPVNSSEIEDLYVQAAPNVEFPSIAAVNNWLAQPEVVSAGQILSSTYIK